MSSNNINPGVAPQLRELILAGVPTLAMVLVMGPTTGMGPAMGPTVDMGPVMGPTMGMGLVLGPTTVMAVVMVVATGRAMATGTVVAMGRAMATDTVVAMGRAMVTDTVAVMGRGAVMDTVVDTVEDTVLQKTRHQPRPHLPVRQLPTPPILNLPAGTLPSFSSFLNECNTDGLHFLGTTHWENELMLAQRTHGRDGPKTRVESIYQFHAACRSEDTYLLTLIVNFN